MKFGAIRITSLKGMVSVKIEIINLKIYSESKSPNHELDNMTKLVRGMLHDALDAFARITLNSIFKFLILDFGEFSDNKP